MEKERVNETSTKSQVLPNNTITSESVKKKKKIHTHTYIYLEGFYKPDNELSLLLCITLFNSLNNSIV